MFKMFGSTDVSQPVPNTKSMGFCSVNAGHARIVRKKRISPIMTNDDSPAALATAKKILSAVLEGFARSFLGAGTFVIERMLVSQGEGELVEK
jgi:hypothetical protein